MAETQDIHHLLRPGVSVRLHSLVGAKSLNGTVAKCIAFDDTTGRWSVALETREHKHVKSENLEIVGARLHSSLPLLRPGIRARLHSLLQKCTASLNGKVVQCIGFNSTTGRWSVALENGDYKNVKPEHLEAIEESVSTPRLRLQNPILKRDFLDRVHVVRIGKGKFKEPTVQVTQCAPQICRKSAVVRKRKTARKKLKPGKRFDPVQVEVERLFMDHEEYQPLNGDSDFDNADDYDSSDESGIDDYVSSSSAQHGFSSLSPRVSVEHRTKDATSDDEFFNINGIIRDADREFDLEKSLEGDAKSGCSKSTPRPLSAAGRRSLSKMEEERTRLILFEQRLKRELGMAAPGRPAKKVSKGSAKTMLDDASWVKLSTGVAKCPFQSKRLSGKTSRSKVELRTMTKYVGERVKRYSSLVTKIAGLELEIGKACNVVNSGTVAVKAESVLQKKKQDLHKLVLDQELKIVESELALVTPARSTRSARTQVADRLRANTSAIKVNRLKAEIRELEAKIQEQNLRTEEKEQQREIARKLEEIDRMRTAQKG